jgi:hypothetical protein
MSALTWKRNAGNNWDVMEARGAGGRYKIRKHNKNFIVTYCPPKRRWWPEIGEAASLQEAYAVAQAHNDKGRRS